MQLTCPHCQAAWEFADRHPSFCPSCGKPLTAEAPTQVFVPPSRPDSEAETLAAERQPDGKNDEEPTVVGGYRLLRVLGVGGMGKVYEAQDITSGSRVALKLVAAEYAGSADAVERFRQEGRLASLIAHPRCVFVLAAEEENGRPYIVMELMDGDNLDDFIRANGPQVPARAVRMVLDIIEGLKEAHRVGVIHRDVKPSNCFFGSDGKLKIGDFGLSKSLAQNANLTKTGSFLGTPLYASPEQVRGETVDAQSDVYSTAATLYCLLTGRAPFQCDNAAVTLARIAADPVPSMRTVRPTLSPELDAVVLRGLERDRRMRWRDMTEFGDALRPFLPGRRSLGVQGVRFGALAMDLVALWILAIPVAVLAERNSSYDVSAVLSRIALWLVYFGLPEAIGGCSAAKWLLGLRVRDSATGHRADWVHLVLRPMVFVLAFHLGSLLAAFVILPMQQWEKVIGPRTITPWEYAQLWLSSWIMTGAGCLILAVPMRARNGYRGLHEILSGTRVVRQSRAVKGWSLPVASDSQVLSRPPGLPARIGTYVVRGAYRWDDNGGVLLGADPTLGRQVMIWMRPGTMPQLPASRREVSRTTRPRWLSAGQMKGQHWDAFVAPAGGSLAALVAANGPLPWAQARALLKQLTEELQLAIKEHSLPAVLSVDCVWVQADGRVILLDTPLSPATGNESADPVPEKRALDHVARVAVLALEGKMPSAELPSHVRVPLPLPAHETLQKLMRFESNRFRLRDFRERLAAQQAAPPTVTWARRAWQLALMAVLLVSGGCFVPYAAFMRQIAPGLEIVANNSKTENDLDKLELASVSELLCDGLNSHPLARLRAYAQLEADEQLRSQLEQSIDRERRMRGTRANNNVFTRALFPEQMTDAPSAIPRRRKWPDAWTVGETDVEAIRMSAASHLHQGQDDYSTSRGFSMMMTTILTVGAPVLWVLWQFVIPGGLSFLMAGIVIVRKDGRPASRLRCALRVFLVWAPICAMLLLSAWLEDWYWSTWRPGVSQQMWPLWVSSALWWASWMVPLLYLLLALKNPRRSLLDRLVGTYLVPG